MTTKLNGIDDEGYYRENGAIVTGGKGLIQIGEDYYYVVYSGKIYKNGSRTITGKYTNGLFPDGTYTFDPDGRLVK